MKISFIISTYNQPDYLDLTLQSIAMQEKIDFADMEVIIADDGSAENTLALINRFKSDFPCPIKHVWQPDNGFQKAMILNKAVTVASGEYLLFVDGDCVIPADFAKNQLLLRETGYFVAGNRVLLSQEFTNKLLTSRSIKFTRWSPLLWVLARISGKTNKLTHWLRSDVNAAWRKSRSDNWRFPKGCNIALSKADFLAVNGYDEAFSGWGHEDADFFVRMLHRGLRIKDGRLAAPVYHLWHKFNDRNHEEENMRRLLERVNDFNVVRAGKGIDQYLGVNSSQFLRHEPNPAN